MIYLATLPIILLRNIEWAITNLQIEESAPAFAKLSLFLLQFVAVAFLLVFYYNFELIAPYQQTLKITTRSNRKLWFYTEESEELTGILKNENE